MECVFCNHSDLKFENKLAFAIFDANPVTTGHMLIVIKRHLPSFFDASKEEKDALFELVDTCRMHLTQNYHPDGFNIGINIGESAGQTIMHMHIHLIPRYKGDIENPRGGVRGVIPGKRIY
jgi:diadenosine tetraphosphate (Ap4A) HIT family hydrolase